MKLLYPESHRRFLFQFALCLLIFSSTESFSQFVNGDFQTNSSYGCNAGLGWSFSTGSGSEPELTDIFYPGNWWIDLTPCGGWGNNTWIEQSVPTVVNQCYTISFDLGCVYGWDVSDAGVLVSINGVQLGERMVSNSFSLEPATLGWTTLTTISFIATGTSTLIRFTGEGHCTEFSVDTGQYACAPVGALGNPGVMGLDNIVLNALNVQGASSASFEVALCANDSIMIGGYSQGNSYLWSTGDTTPYIEVTQGGTYLLEFSNSCASGMDSVFVIEQSIPDIISLGNDTTFCNAFLYELPFQVDSVIWSNGSYDYSMQVTTAGLYWAVNENECGISSDSIVIYSDQTISFNLQDEEICSGDSIEIGQAIGGIQYLWNNNATSPTIIVDQTGDYQFSYSSLCSNGEVSIHVEVIDAPPPILLGEDLSLCPPISYQIPVQSETVQWSTGVNSTSITIFDAGTYWAINQNECGTVMDSITINLMPQIDFVLDALYTICDGEPLLLTLPNEIVNYEWSNDETMHTASFTQNGDYFLVFFDGCASIMEDFAVSVLDCDCHIFIPNVFTANNDGLNDYWNTSISDNCIFTLAVWNRWGNKIFETSSNKIFWTGNVDGGEFYAPDGVYYYTLKYSHESIDWRKKSGVVTLLR